MEGLGGISGPDVNTSIFPVGSCFTGCFSFVLIGVSEHSDSAPSFLINATFEQLRAATPSSQQRLVRTWAAYAAVLLAVPSTGICHLISETGQHPLPERPHGQWEGWVYANYACSAQGKRRHHPGQGLRLVHPIDSEEPSTSFYPISVS